jgi:hypothetical protein
LASTWSVVFSELSSTVSLIYICISFLNFAQS